MDGASKATLENEFGTPKDDDCIIKILENGQAQQTQVCNHSIGQISSRTKLTSWYQSRPESVVEVATTPRDLWPDLVRISKAADLGGMDEGMDATVKQEQSSVQTGA